MSIRNVGRNAGDTWKTVSTEGPGQRNKGERPIQQLVIGTLDWKAHIDEAMADPLTRSTWATCTPTAWKPRVEEPWE